MLSVNVIFSLKMLITMNIRNSGIFVICIGHLDKCFGFLNCFSISRTYRKSVLYLFYFNVVTSFVCLMDLLSLDNSL